MAPVEITSGGTGGPTLDESYQDLPNNFYGSLAGPPPAGDVAEALYHAGWNVRKASWTEYEVSNTWAELLIIPKGLVAGVVAPEHRDRLLALFADLGFECEADPEEPTT